MTAKEATRGIIREMAVGSIKPIKNMRAYDMLVDLYCEGEPFTIDTEKGLIRRETEDFTLRRLNYTSGLIENIKKQNNESNRRNGNR